VILTVRLVPKEAKALTEMCKRFRYPDAQHLLMDAHNVTPTNLCEAVTSVLNALTAASRQAMPTDTSPTVTAKSSAHVTITFAIEKAELAKDRLFLETLLAMAPSAGRAIGSPPSGRVPDGRVCRGPLPTLRLPAD
jgi:hypothetical protein